MCFKTTSWEQLSLFQFSRGTVSGTLPRAWNYFIQINSGGNVCVHSSLSTKFFESLHNFFAGVRVGGVKGGRFTIKYHYGFILMSSRQ